MKYAIKPITFLGVTATQLLLSPPQIQMGVTARAQYCLLDANDNEVTPRKEVVLSSTLYQQWGLDDTIAPGLFVQQLASDGVSVTLV